MFLISTLLFIDDSQIASCKSCMTYVAKTSPSYRFQTTSEQYVITSIWSPRKNNSSCLGTYSTSASSYVMIDAVILRTWKVLNISRRQYLTRWVEARTTSATIKI